MFSCGFKIVNAFQFFGNEFLGEIRYAAVVRTRLLGWKTPPPARDGSGKPGGGATAGTRAAEAVRNRTDPVRRCDGRSTTEDLQRTARPAA